VAGSHKRTSLQWNSVDYCRKNLYSIGRTQKSFCGWGMEGEHCTQKEREKSKKERKKSIGGGTYRSLNVSVRLAKRVF